VDLVPTLRELRDERRVLSKVELRPAGEEEDTQVPDLRLIGRLDR
jgi:hypothetical protein